MKVIHNRSHNAYSDSELIELVKESSDALTIVYENHKEYCINFMKAMYNNGDEIKDIYQDAVIVFYENAVKPGFNLTCSIQTYLNSICRNQVLTRFAQSKKQTFSSVEDNGEYLESLTDWFDDRNQVNNERVAALILILNEMKESASKCYDILVRFFYENQTMEKIAEAMDYNNSRTVITKKYKCQEKLKAELFKRLKK